MNKYLKFFLITSSVFFINLKSFGINNIKKTNDIYKIEIITFVNKVDPSNLYSNFDKLNVPNKALILKESKKENSNLIIETDSSDNNSSPKTLSEFTEINSNNSEDLIINESESIKANTNSAIILNTKISKDKFSLKEFEKKLEISNNYKILSHYAWYQDLSNKSSIYFTGGENFYQKDNKSLSNDLINKNKEFSKNFKINQENLDKIDSNTFKYLNPEWELEGYISLQKFTRNKVNININLLTNVPVQIANYLHYKTFTIKQSRNTNIDEAIYFDNPYFGAIVYISKV